MLEPLLHSRTFHWMLRRIFCSFLLLSVPLFGADDDRVVQRYKEMLQKNPVEGTALDRIWTIYQNRAETPKLIEEYAGVRDSFPGAMIYGHLCKRAGKSDEARAAYQAAAKLNPSSALPWLALAELTTDKPEEAANALAVAAERQPAAEILMREGNKWLAAGRREKASAAWQKALTLAPDDINLREQLARNYEANGFTTQAIAQFEEISTRGDPAQKAHALEELARFQQLRGDADAAISALERALAIVAPGHWMRHSLENKLVRTYQRYHRLPELEARWNKAAEDSPSDLGAQLQLATLYQQSGDVDALTKCLRRIIALAPNKPEYKQQLVRILVQSVHLDEAASLLDELIAAQPENVSLVFDRAELDLKREKTTEAEARIEEVLTRHPDPAVRTQAIEFYNRHRLYAQAEKHLQKTATEGPDQALALAAFQLDRRKIPAALSAIRLAAAPSLPAEKRVEILTRAAGMLRERELSLEALEFIREAVKLKPESASLHSQLGQVLGLASDLKQGFSELEEAYRLEPTEENDQQLFQFLSTRQFQPDSTGLPVKSPTPLPPDLFLPAFITKLTQGAEKSGKAEELIRAARWNGWNRNAAAAIRLAERAISADPKNVAARELIARFADTPLDRTLANKRLKELIELQPDRATGYRKQLADLAARGGSTDDAIAVYSALAEENPGDFNAMSDLAIAQQNAGRWSDALSTWQKAYAAAPDSRRAEIVPPLLRVMDRLQLHQKAAELLLERTRTGGDETARRNALADLLRICEEHNLLDWLQQEFERRHQAQPNDYFVATALSQILKAAGHPDEAFSLLSDAAILAPEQLQALEEVVHEAEAIGNLEAALASQRRLVNIAEPDDPKPAEHLAELLERTMRVDEATEAWQRTSRLFARDVSVLRHAASFYIRWQQPEPARELLRRIRSLDPANVDAIAELAGLTGGNEALACWEQVLANTTPVKDGETLVYPPRERVEPAQVQRTVMRSALDRGAQPNADTAHALQTFWSDGGNRLPDSAKYRLLAIREISEALLSGADRAALRTWNQRWAGGPSKMEALWAHYYSRDQASLQAVLSELMRQRPDDSMLKSAFLWLTLEMQQYEAVAAWLLEDSRLPSDRDGFPIALNQHLLRSNPANDIANRLFPEPFTRLRSLLWDSALTFAHAGRLSDGIALGSRVVGKSAFRKAEYSLEFAHWHLLNGDPSAARAVLRDVIRGAGNGFDHPVYRALREYVLLLPQQERIPFTESYLNELPRNSKHARIVAIILHGMTGETEKAHSAVDSLLQARLLSGGQDDLGEAQAAQRYWSFILTAGLQLEAWHMEDLADYLWQRSLADAASVRLQSEQAAPVIRELGIRRSFRQIAILPRPDQPEAIEHVLRTQGSEQCLVLANLFENNRYTAEALETYYTLWKSDSASFHFARNLVNLCRAPGDSDRQLAVLLELSNGIVKGGDPALNRDIVLQTVESLTQRKDYGRASEVLKTALALYPTDRALIDRGIDLFQKRQDFATAETLIKKIPPADASAKIATVDFLLAQGKREEAIRVLQQLRSPDADAKLAELYAATGRYDRALWLCRRLLAAGRFDAVTRVAAVMREKQPESAVRMLSNAVYQSRGGSVAFAMQQKIVEWLGSKDPRFEQQSLRLRNLSGPSRALTSAYYDAICSIPQPRERLEAKLKTDFAEGKGSLMAGIKLIQLFLQSSQNEKVTAVVGQILRDQAISDNELGALHHALRGANRHAEAVLVSKRLAARVTQREPWNIEHVRDLAAVGRKEDAANHLDRVALRTVFNEQLLPGVAGAYHDLGNAENAGKYYTLALEADPLSSNFSTFARYAALLLQQSRDAEARRILKAGYRNPANREMEPLAGLLVKANRIDSVEQETAAFDLTKGQRVALLRSVFLKQCEAKQNDSALTFAQAHPELIQNDSATIIALDHLAVQTAQFEPVAKLLDGVIAEFESPEISASVANFYSNWSNLEAELGHKELALKHLSRAHELNPIAWQFAGRLAKMFVEENAPEKARAILKEFAESTAPAADRDAARKQLESLPQ